MSFDTDLGGRGATPELAALLHSCFYAFERAHGKLTGSASKEILREIVEDLPDILHFRGEHIVDDSLPLDENLRRFEEYLSDLQVFENAEFKEGGGGRYRFVVEGCALGRSGTHDMVRTNESTCPFAIVAASILYYLTKQDVHIHESEYFPGGTATLIQIQE